MRGKDKCRILREIRRKIAEENDIALITKDCHSQVTAPGYACCYAWGIRHLPGDPWDKTRVDDPTHEWLVKDDADEHIWKCPTGY